MVNRFVLDKSHPRMRYDVWFSTFSGSLHSACCFRQASLTVEYVLCKTTFAGNWFLEELRNFDVEMMDVGFAIAWQFGMTFVIFACACSTTNSKPFPTWFYFNNFVDEKFVELVLSFCCM